MSEEVHGYMDDCEFLGKIEWEGGVLSALEYGLGAADLEDKSTELAQVWQELMSSYTTMKPLISRVEKMISETFGE